MEELEVMSLKLTSGEELVAKVRFVDDETAELHDARSLMLLPGGQLKLAPVLFSGDMDRAIMLNRRTISLLTRNVHPKFLEEYTRSVSPLTIPKPSIIMG
jgi:hypothetical protein